MLGEGSVLRQLMEVGLELNRFLSPMYSRL